MWCRVVRAPGIIVEKLFRREIGLFLQYLSADVVFVVVCVTAQKCGLLGLYWRQFHKRQNVVVVDDRLLFL